MSTIEEILSKLHKIKQQASAAPDFLALQKVSEKINKIRSKLAQFSNNREFTTIMDKIELLIKEKNRYFKEKMIKNTNKIQKANEISNEDANRTLKYSKSAENLKVFPPKKPTDTMTISGNILNKTISGSKKQLLSFKNLDGQNIENRDRTVYIRNSRENNRMYGDDDQSEFLERSSVHGSQSQSQINTKKNSKYAKGKQKSKKSKSPQEHSYHEESQQKTTYIKKPKLFHNEKERLQNEVDFLQQKLIFSFQQIEDLSKKVSVLEKTKQTPALPQETKSRMGQKYFLKQQQIVNYYKDQLNSKNLIIQDQNSKISYFKSMNEELKNRILNEQRRNQDYIDELKVQIKNLKKQIEKYRKENEELNNEIEDLQGKNEGLISEIKKLLQKLEDEVRDKQKIKRTIVSSSALKTQQLQREIAHLSTQSANLSRLQIKLQHEQQQKEYLTKYREKLEARITQLEKQSNKYHEERDKFELQVSKMAEENICLQNELKVNIQAKQLLAEQLLDMKQKLDEQLRVTNLLQYEKDLKTKNKVNKLKEIKGILTQLK